MNVLRDEMDPDTHSEAGSSRRRGSNRRSRGVSETPTEATTGEDSSSEEDDEGEPTPRQALSRNVKQMKSVAEEEEEEDEEEDDDVESMLDDSF